MSKEMRELRVLSLKQSLDEKAAERMRELMETVREDTSRALQATVARKLLLQSVKEFFPLQLSDFGDLRTVGTGKFSSVSLATHKKTGRTLALKIRRKTELVRLDMIARVAEEKIILPTLDHPFTVACAGSFQDEARLVTVLEPVTGGNLLQALDRVPRLQNDDAKFFGAQLVTVLEYLHGQQIIFRNLMPENLCFAGDGRLSLSLSPPPSFPLWPVELDCLNPVGHSSFLCRLCAVPRRLPQTRGLRSRQTRESGISTIIHATLSIRTRIHGT